MSSPWDMYDTRRVCIITKVVEESFLVRYNKVQQPPVVVVQNVALRSCIIMLYCKVAHCPDVVFAKCDLLQM